MSTSLAENVLTQWKEFDLEGKRNELDSQASTITEVREESLASRKKLASATREFKKIPANEKLKSVGPLLKTYQQEIDQLTQRCKGAESAFLTLYASLQPLSDPCIGLNEAIEASKMSSDIGKLQLENKNLRGQIEEFQAEFKDIKNQEVTIRRLEDKIKEYETKMESIVQNQIEETSESMRVETESTITQLREREESLTHQLEQTKNELTRAVSQNDSHQNTLLQEKQYYEEKLEAKQDELEYIAGEINRVTSENEKLKRDLGRLKKEMEDSSKGTSTEENTRIEKLSISLAQKEQDLIDAEARIRSVNEKLVALETSHNEAILDLQKDLLYQTDRVESLSHELEHRPTKEQYRDLQNQIKLLKGIEGFNESEEINTSKDTVESLLQQKNKRLETQIVNQKEILASNEKKIEELQVVVDTITEKSKNQKLLIQKLEQDLLQGYNSGQSSPLSGSSDSIPTPTGSTNAPPRVDSMLKIVCTQRDRFQTKLQKAELGKEELEKSVRDLQRELTALQTDNVKLYQKIQFLESYNTKRTPRDLESGEVETKYKRMYEDTVNPFLEFNRKERYSKYQQLNAAERVTLSMGDFFLSNKFSRIFILVYTLILHLFIFVLMYKFAQLPSHCPAQ